MSRCLTWGLVVASMVAGRPCLAALTVDSSAELAPPVLVTTPSVIELTTFRGARAKILLSLRNGGGGKLSWSVVRAPRWMTVSPRKGELAHGEEEEVTVLLETLSLPDGASEGELLIRSNEDGGSLLRMGVAMDIVAIPAASDGRPLSESESIPRWRQRLKRIPDSQRTVWHSAWIGNIPVSSHYLTSTFQLTYRQRRLLSPGREIEWSASFQSLWADYSDFAVPENELMDVTSLEFTLGARKSWDYRRKHVGASVSAGVLMWLTVGGRDYNGMTSTFDSANGVGLGLYAAARVRINILNLEIRQRIGPNMPDTRYLGDWDLATELRIGLGWEW